MKGRAILMRALLPAFFVTLPAAHAETGSAAAYKVVDGSKVDANTLQGWKTWRALACERCHGAKQEGMVGPSLIDALKTLDKTEFHRTVFGGRVDKIVGDAILALFGAPTAHEDDAERAVRAALRMQ